MAGFDVDPVALRSAVNKLKDQQHELEQLSAGTPHSTEAPLAS